MPSGKHVTTLELLEAKRAGRKIVVLTAYDALFAQLLDESGVDVVLVGDSVNTVLAGQDSTLSATLEQMIYHTRMVRAGVRRALVIIDLPFLTYQVSIEEAKRNAGRAMQLTGANGVKLEGGLAIRETVRALVDIGIPVMGHVGFTPQSVHALGGPRVQGRGAQAGYRIVADAKALEEAGAFSVV
ncbi:MAG: 3-methyl-2-oxobutanoate hydroxymethyltransferase, partial [Gemmatimonadetes bacterium RIFCSPLOWO2_12_FULL_68_9]